MKMHTLLSPHNVEELYFTGKTTVVIDVLRASTTIITALGNGAKEVIPVDSLDFAVKVSGAAFGSTTPTFSSAAPGFVAVSEGLTVAENDRLQIRIANTTDLDPLQVVAARLVIGED